MAFRNIITPVNFDALKRKFDEGAISIDDLMLIVSVILDNGRNIEAMAKSISETGVGTWKFDNVITAQPPTQQGKFRFNNINPAAATEIYLHEVTSIDMKDTSNFIRAFESGDRLYIQQRNDATRWARFTIGIAPIDNGDWWTIQVTPTSNSGIPIINNLDTIIRATF